MRCLSKLRDILFCGALCIWFIMLYTGTKKYGSQVHCLALGEIAQGLYNCRDDIYLINCWTIFCLLYWHINNMDCWESEVIHLAHYKWLSSLLFVWLISSAWPIIKQSAVYSLCTKLLSLTVFLIGVFSLISFIAYLFCILVFPDICPETSSSPGIP